MDELIDAQASKGSKDARRIEELEQQNDALSKSLEHQKTVSAKTYADLQKQQTTVIGNHQVRPVNKPKTTTTTVSVTASYGNGNGQSDELPPTRAIWARALGASYGAYGLDGSFANHVINKHERNFNQCVSRPEEFASTEQGNRTRGVYPESIFNKDAMVMRPFGEYY